MNRCLAAVAALCSAAVFASPSASFAQVVYEPVRYQHESGNGERYCYGGSDPAVHAAAGAFDNCPRVFYGGVNLHRFDGGQTFNQPSPISRFERGERVYSDCVGLREASWFGYTCADARNEAYANAPTYFRKADLLAAAIPTRDGAWAVPAAPPPALYQHHHGLHRLPIAPGMRPASGPATGPATQQRGQILIIPKNLMERKLSDFEKKPQKIALAK